MMVVSRADLQYTVAARRRGRPDGSELLEVDPAHRRPLRCGARPRTVRNTAVRACDDSDFHALKFDGSCVISGWSKTYATFQSRNWKARTKRDGSVVPVEIKHQPPHYPCQIRFSFGLTSSC
ncbi:hypothetical protein OROGR_031516 [Orobanche gracilis]